VKKRRGRLAGRSGSTGFNIGPKSLAKGCAALMFASLCIKVKRDEIKKSSRQNVNKID